MRRRPKWTGPEAERLEAEFEASEAPAIEDEIVEPSAVEAAVKAEAPRRVLRARTSIDYRCFSGTRAHALTGAIIDDMPGDVQEECLARGLVERCEA